MLRPAYATPPAMLATPPRVVRRLSITPSPPSLHKDQVATGPTLLSSTIRSYLPAQKPLSPMDTGRFLGEEDWLDQQVQMFFALRAQSQAHRRHTVTHKGGGYYELDGRRVLIEWQAAGPIPSEGRLLVVDGPLRQPLADYLNASEANAEYEAVIADVGTKMVHFIPRDQRLSFNDQHEAYSRLDAMKVAKAQALVREKAAGYMQAGKAVPREILASYSKSIQQKLAPVTLQKICERSTTMP